MNTGGPASEKTLLDEFAGQALTSRGLYGANVRENEVAKECYTIAFAMLAEKARREAVVQESSTTHDDGKVAELQEANRELVEALEALVGDNSATSLCMHKGEDSFGRVMGTWGSNAELKARAILAKHKGAA